MLRKCKITILTFVLIAAISDLYSQKEDAVRRIIERITEYHAYSEMSENEVEKISEELYILIETPISLNSNNLTPLSEVMLLSEYQIAAINKYRRQHGDIQTIWELSLLPEFSHENIETIAPFVSVTTSDRVDPVTNILSHIKHETLSEYKRNIELSDGYKSSADKPAPYAGPPGRIYFRHRVKSGRNLSLGITAEKDPGEVTFSKQNRGFDFYSAHAYISFDKIVNALIIGDYTVSLGNGLTAGSGLLSGKSSNAVSVRQSRNSLRQHTGSAEYGFMRGAALSLRYGNLSSNMFISHNSIDAAIEVDSLSSQLTLKSIQQTGLHRTLKELNSRKRARQSVLGTSLHYNYKSLTLGINYVTTLYTAPISNNGSLEKLFAPTTNLFHNISSDYRYFNGYVQIWGEAAIDRYYNPALLQGLQLRTSDILQLAFLYRNYSPRYSSPLSVSFGDTHKTSNEEGVYSGIQFYPFSTMEVNAYVDLFRFPWLKARHSAPSYGYDYMFDCSWVHKRGLRLSMRFRHKSGLSDITTDSNITPIMTMQSIARWHFQSEFDITDNLSMQTRIATAHFDNSQQKKTGWLMYHDVTYRLVQSRIGVSARYAIFDIDGYEARIYAYERDVLYSNSIPAYFSKGSRYYFVVSWSVTRNFDIYTKWSQTIFNNIDNFGSGNDRIAGNSVSQITVKMRARF